MSIRSYLTAAVFLLLGLLAGCERPPVESVQHGYRGTGMVLVYNPRTVEAQLPNNLPPPVSPAVPQDGPKAGTVYQNVKVLGDLSIAEFTRTMSAMAQWIAPNEGCAYCHNLQNLADDGKYQKVVARRMLEMTRHVNADWQNHVKQTGVTCWTCHRGKPVPEQVWFKAMPQDHKSNFIGDLAEQNLASPTVGLSSLPYDPFTPYLEQDLPIRVVSQTALPEGSRKSIKQTEFTYGLMMHMSGALGVNCSFCHNSHSFTSWENSPPQRVTAWYGIRMARDLNAAYLEGLTSVFPANRKGPTGDVAKVNCSTCHQGAYKPLYGAQMAKAYPALTGPSAAASGATASLPAPVAEARRSVLYFGVGSAMLDGAQAKGLAQVIATMSSDANSVVAISGYHSAAGEQAANQELAKQRAVSVRDALLAAGIQEARVTLAKPQSAEANLAGEDPAARRVEVTLQ